MSEEKQANFYCPKCKNPLVALIDKTIVVRCSKCQTMLKFDEASGKYDIINRKTITPPSGVKENTLGYPRSYFWYFLFGLLTLGIGSIIYLMNCLRDLEKHETYLEVEEGAGLIVTEKDVFRNFRSIMSSNGERVHFFSLYLYLTFFFIAIPYDIIQAVADKYSSLYNHLKGQAKKTAPTKAPNPKVYLIGLSMFLISTIVVIISVVFYLLTNLSFSWLIALCISGSFAFSGFLMISICAALWQKAFNDHIKALNKLGFY